LLTQALGRVKRVAKPEHYAIYHTHVIEKRSVDEVRGTLGVSRAAIYMGKFRVGAMLREAVKLLRAQED
jgi:hypothetical protein